MTNLKKRKKLLENLVFLHKKIKILFTKKKSYDIFVILNKIKEKKICQNMK